MKKLTGFSGSRNLSPEWEPLITTIVTEIANTGSTIAVGCMRGVDGYVRQAAPNAQVFHASHYGKGRSAFAQRSKHLVETVAKSGNGQLIAFIDKACPQGIRPMGRWTSGKPASGTWSTIAYSIGLNIPTTIFWCCAFDRWPNWTDGTWVQAKGGIWTNSWQWQPNLTLFALR